MAHTAWDMVLLFTGECGMCCTEDAVTYNKVTKRGKKMLLSFCSHCGATDLIGKSTSVELYRGDYEEAISYYDRGKVILLFKPGE